MYFLSSDGSVRSYTAEQSFGWWLKDFDLTDSDMNQKQTCEYCAAIAGDVQVDRVQSVDEPNVSEEIASKCRKCDVSDLYVPATDNLTELIHENDPRQMLLFALVKPTMWNEKYQEKYNQIYHVSGTKHMKYRTGSILHIDKTNNNVYPDFSEPKIRIYPDDPVCLLLPKLAQIQELLNDIKEEIVEMRYTLKNLKQDFLQDETHISHIIEETICFTRSVYDAKHLDNLILLLNEDLTKASLQSWPFWSETSITYSGMERNYIV